MLDILLGLLKANALTTITLTLFLISAILAILIAYFEKKYEAEEAKEKRKRAVVITATVLAVVTFVQGALGLYDPSSWIPTKKAEKVYEQYPNQYHVTSFQHGNNSYAGITDGIFFISPEDFRATYNRFSEEKIDFFYTRETILSSLEDDSHSGLKFDDYTFTDSSRLSLVSSVSFDGMENILCILFDFPFSFENALDDEYITTIDRVVHTAIASIDALYQDKHSVVFPFSRSVDLSARLRQLYMLNLGGGTTCASYVEMPLSEDDSSELSTEEVNVLKRYPEKAFYLYLTKDSIKVYVVPQLDREANGIVNLKNLASSDAGYSFEDSPPINVSPGDCLKISIPIAFLHDKEGDIHINPREMTLRVSLPENIKYISNSTKLTSWENNIADSTEVPDGITTESGLSMGVVMPDYIVKDVTLLVQVSPIKNLYAEYNAPVITARIQSGNNEIEQSIILNVK